jgi:hypothetical protein
MIYSFEFGGKVASVCVLCCKLLKVLTLYPVKYEMFELPLPTQLHYNLMK